MREYSMSPDARCEVCGMTVAEAREAGVVEACVKSFDLDHHFTIPARVYGYTACSVPECRRRALASGKCKLHEDNPK